MREQGSRVLLNMRRFSQPDTTFTGQMSTIVFLDIPVSTPDSSHISGLERRTMPQPYASVYDY